MAPNEKPIDYENELENIFTTTNKYWKTQFTDKDWLELEAANGIASKAKDKYVGDLTSDAWMTNSSQFETTREQLELDDHLNYAVDRAYVLGYSLLFMGFRDGKEFEEEAMKGQIPDYIMTIPKTWIKEDIDFNNENRDYYTLYGKNKVGEVKVHKSRVIRVQFNKNKESMYMPAYRGLYVADNILWSDGQAAFRLAAGLTHVSIKDPKKLPLDGQTVSEINYVKKKGMLSNINAKTAFVSDDRYAVDVKGVTGNKIDLKAHWDIALQAAAMALKVPFELIIGAAAGAVTGSETNIKDYYGELNKFRIKFMGGLIRDVSEVFGLAPLEIDFETLFEETDTEKTVMLERDMKSMVLGFQSGLLSKQTALKYLNDEYETEFIEGEAVNQTIGTVQTPTVTASGDAAEPKSKLEKGIGKRLLEDSVKSLLNVFDDSFDFGSELDKAMKNSIYFDSKLKRIVRKVFNKDNDDELKLIILGAVNLFNDNARLKFSQALGYTWDGAWKISSKEIEQLVSVTDRAKQLKKAAQDTAMELVQGASDEMKKDLTFQLSEALKNEETTRQAAKRFRNYVSADFANKYKNRLETIADTEAVRVFNEASVTAYQESGEVESKMWLTARDDRVRAQHRAVDGETVPVDKSFSLGVMAPPHGTRCRCTVIPVLKKLKR